MSDKSKPRHYIVMHAYHNAVLAIRDTREEAITAMGELINIDESDCAFNTQVSALYITTSKERVPL